MTELSNGFVVVMGLGTVFIGLVCIVAICMLMSLVIKAFSKDSGATTTVTAPVPTGAKSAALDPKTKAEIIAGACACIAEELGEDASNIKVVSFKQI